jgi:hypothetical protein
MGARRHLDVQVRAVVFNDVTERLVEIEHRILDRPAIGFA